MHNKKTNRLHTLCVFAILLIALCCLLFFANSDQSVITSSPQSDSVTDEQDYGMNVTTENLEQSHQASVATEDSGQENKAAEISGAGNASYTSDETPKKVEPRFKVDEVQESSTEPISPVVDILVGDDIINNGESYSNQTYRLLTVPNDQLPTQWWTTTTDLNRAWDYGYGNYQSTIAIIDSGFSLNHDELIDRWAINEKESGPTTKELPSKLNCTDQALPLNKICNNIDDNFDGVIDNEFGFTNRENPSFLNCSDQDLALDKSCNRIDDDANGYTDDYRGWDFSNFDNSVQAGETNLEGSGIHHGTMVSGIAAGTGNNSVGIAGVDWGSKILPIQAMDDDSNGNTLTISRAVYYAADQGADVINISLGTDKYDEYLRVAIDYALSKGSLVVAASGNDGCNCISYPANFPEVVAVGASNIDSSKSNFTSYGDNLDFLAPGENMITPYFSESNNQYARVNGTSFASPLVAGALSFLKSHEPQASWGEIIATINSTSNKSPLPVGEAFSPQFGWGIVNFGELADQLNSSETITDVSKFDTNAPADVLGVNNIINCASTQLPSVKIYELTKPGFAGSYTASELEKRNLELDGWQTNDNALTCSSLPGDSHKYTDLIDLDGNFEVIFTGQP